MLFRSQIYLFIFGCFGSFVAAPGLSLVTASGGYSSVQCTGFSLRGLLIAVTSLVAEQENGL